MSGYSGSSAERGPERELRELDAAVARAIGWKWRVIVHDGGKWHIPLSPSEQREEYVLVDSIPDENHSTKLPKFSTSADAALSAYEVMRGRGWRISQCAQYWTEDDWSLQIAHQRGAVGSAMGCGPTFAEALCRAIVAAAALEGN